MPAEAGTGAREAAKSLRSTEQVMSGICGVLRGGPYLPRLHYVKDPTLP